MQVHAGFSSSEPASISRFEQRKLYVEAIDDIEQGRISSAQRIARQLTDYPLYPYIEYTEKIYTLPRQSASAILEFRDRYHDLPIADQLMENWVYILAKQGRWSEFLKYYDPKTFVGQRNACFYAWALYKTGQQQQAFDEARKLWLVNFSQPDECDPIFRVWRESGQLDNEAAWQRYLMSIQSNKVSLANYLTRFLSDSDRKTAERFVEVRRHPKTIARTARFTANDEKTNALILYGVNRLAYRDAATAFRTLMTYTGTHHFDANDLDETWTNVGVRLAQDGDKEGLLDALPINLQDNERLTTARIRLALRQLAWSQVLVFMNLLPEDEQQSSRWQFWKARVLTGSNDPKDQQNAREIYTSLSQTRDFYGFLSADAIGTQYQFDNTPVAVSNGDVLKLEKQPGIQRALELFTLNERNRARREWYFTTRDFDKSQLQVAARVAQKWGWYRQAIKSMIDANAWNDLDIRFPLAYYDSFVSYARTADIPLPWTLAIARQESSFMPDARSSAGALGVMQVMPGTARLTAHRHGIDFSGRDDLMQPIPNIHIGSAYLGSLLRKFNNNRVVASAAYNAGPARVENWVDPSLPLDVWIETLPFPETRDYVENVLMFSAIYSRRLALSHPFIYNHELDDFSNPQVVVNSADTRHTVLAKDAGQGQ
ncbi:MAG TPA: transglycosylase SLT domain-containing protein [Pseudomonadales bacterium]|nr:transglycosylase SLT domain-containing protein [Pseudomonadales bacterium]